MEAGAPTRVGLSSTSTPTPALCSSVATNCHRLRALEQLMKVCSSPSFVRSSWHIGHSRGFAGFGSTVFLHRRRRMASLALCGIPLILAASTKWRSTSSPAMPAHRAHTSVGGRTPRFSQRFLHCRRRNARAGIHILHGRSGGTPPGCRVDAARRFGGCHSTRVPLFRRRQDGERGAIVATDLLADPGGCGLRERVLRRCAYSLPMSPRP